MRIERQHDRWRVGGSRSHGERGQHALMAAMHAVKIADRDPSASVLVRVLKSALDVHREQGGGIASCKLLKANCKLARHRTLSDRHENQMPVSGTTKPLNWPFEICNLQFEIGRAHV